MPSNPEPTTGELKTLQKLLPKYAEASASETVKSHVLGILSDIHTVAQARNARSGRQSSNPLSGEDLQEQHGKDQVEKAFHPMSRRIVAGTSYCLNGSPGKDAWVEDFKLLFKGHFEGYWNPPQAFPATGGREFLAGLLSHMLEEQVTFEQVLKWFPTSGNHVRIHADLEQKLRAKGIQQWPPHADLLPRCATYKPITRKRSHSESGLTDQPAVHPSTSASSLGSRAGPLLYSPSTLLVPTSTRTPPSGYAPGAGHLCAESMPQLAAQAFPVGPMNQPLSPGSRAGPSERAFPAVNEWPHG